MNSPDLNLQDLRWLQPQWPVHERVRSACSLRAGGVSVAPWESLNLGLHVGDDPAAVRENRRRLRKALQLPAEPVWLQQVHGTAVWRADGAPIGPAGPIADAAVTDRPGEVLAIMVADCLPVLFAPKPEARGFALGAAHAGWRGLAAGVLEATVAALPLPASELVAWLGPCIGADQFEVGEEVLQAFTAAGDSARHFRAGRPGHWFADLPGIARARLQRLGIEEIHGGGWCTVGAPMRFFSHRRDAALAQGRSGRFAALIWC
jgi:YfiH family protein